MHFRNIYPLDHLHSGNEMAVTGWFLITYDVPMFLTFLYAVAFSILAALTARGFKIPNRVLTPPAFVGLAQVIVLQVLVREKGPGGVEPGRDRLLRVWCWSAASDRSGSRGRGRRLDRRGLGRGVTSINHG